MGKIEIIVRITRDVRGIKNRRYAEKRSFEGLESFPKAIIWACERSHNYNVVKDWLAIPELEEIKKIK